MSEFSAARRENVVHRGVVAQRSTSRQRRRQRKKLPFEYYPHYTGFCAIGATPKATAEILESFTRELFQLFLVKRAPM